MMHSNYSKSGKEVIALDADDHLARPTIYHLDFSELRLVPLQVDRLGVRPCLRVALCAA
jgi:hypothetical protein